MNRLAQGLLAVAMVLGMSGVVLASDDKDCGLKTLNGRYVFTATGFNIVAGVSQPKAIVEVIDFDGEGAVSVPAVTVSLNGTIVHSSPGANGTYTLDEDCNGTLAFVSGQAFDIVTSPAGKEIWMIQTNPNTVFQGTATRTIRKNEEDGDPF
jgi:hypothetical protein